MGNFLLNHMHPPMLSCIITILNECAENKHLKLDYRPNFNTYEQPTRKYKKIQMPDCPLNAKTINTEILQLDSFCSVFQKMQNH